MTDATIEEAFRELMGTYGRTAHGDGPGKARALALAVLEEAQEAGVDDFTAEEWGVSDRDHVEQLRARIAALGEPADTG